MEQVDLDDTRWALEYLTLGGVSHLVSGRRIPELAFTGDRLRADDGVNEGGGPYSVSGGGFSAGPLVSTRRGYPEPAMPEHGLLEMLAEAHTVVLHGEFLHIAFDGGELVYRFEGDTAELA
jgi:heat shock protein HslJ